MAPSGVKTKAVLLNLRVTAEERAHWKLAAAPASVSAWLRKLANDAAKIEAFEQSGKAVQVRERMKIQQAIRPQRAPVEFDLAQKWKPDSK